MYSFFFNKIFYQDILNGVTEAYDFTLNICTNDDEWDYTGSYNVNNQKLIIIDENECMSELTENLYQKMIEYIPKKIYEEEQILSITVDFSEFISKNFAFQNYFKLNNVMLCNFELYSKRLYSISCDNEEESFSLYFYFNT